MSSTLAGTAAGQVRGDGAAAVRPSTPSMRGLLALVVVAGGAAALWIGAAVLTAGHGFDITDEGFYLLSYRWWRTNEWNFTGAQYLYGPIFEALGYDIAGLRLVRLVTVVATHLALGWTFMRWLRLRRPAAPASRLWEVAGVATIVAAGGLNYGWLPLSPGYDDVVLLGALLTMALTLAAATRVDRRLPIPAWLPAVAGAVAVAMLLAKWISVVAVGLIAIVLAYVAASRGLGQLVRAVGWWLAGFGIAAGCVHLFVVPLTTALPQIAAVNMWVAGGNYSAGGVLYNHARTIALPMISTVSQHPLLLVAAVVAVVARRPAARRLAWALGGVGLGVSVWRALNGGGLSGGTVNVWRYPIVLFAALGFALLTAASVLVTERFGRTREARGARDEPRSREQKRIRSQARPEPTGAARTGGSPVVSSLSGQRRRDWAILGMLLVLPLAQAFGTLNPIFLAAVNGFAAWMAIIIVVVTGVEAAPAVARRLTMVVAIGAVLASACIATGGMWRNPYRTAGRAETTSTVPGVAALASVKLDPQTAAKYSALYAHLRPWVEPGGRAMIALDETPGIVLLLGGRHVGEAWNSNRDPSRMAAGIATECDHGPPWWGARAPILILNRPPISDVVVLALKVCELDFASDYRLLSAEETMGLAVYVPTVGAHTGR